MNILGVVSTNPAISVVGDELQEFAVSASPLAARAGVKTKKVSLPVDYIRTTGNVDPIDGWKVATTTPTLLGTEAVKAVLNQVGISIEQVGLVLGDTGTPYQTCPSEAQRIVGGLGVKTAAYDLVGGIGAVPHFFSVLQRWSADRLPEYLVYVSTNTPTQHVNYRADPESAGVFGDAAVAMLVAKQSPLNIRSLRVARAEFRAEDSRRSPVVVNRSLRIDREALLSRVQLERFVTSELDLLAKSGFQVFEGAFFVLPQLYAAEAAEVLQSHGVSADRFVSGVEDTGFSLGSSYGVALARLWSSLEVGQSVVMMHCGDGRCGSVVLTVS